MKVIHGVIILEEVTKLKTWVGVLSITITLVLVVLLLNRLEILKSMGRNLGISEIILLVLILLVPKPYTIKKYFPECVEHTGQYIITVSKETDMDLFYDTYMILEKTDDTYRVKLKVKE